MVEGALVLLAALYVAYVAVERLREGPELETVGLGIAAMAVSLAVNVGVSFYLVRVARRTGSPALEATAWHRASDIPDLAGCAHRARAHSTHPLGLSRSGCGFGHSRVSGVHGVSHHRPVPSATCWTGASRMRRRRSSGECWPAVPASSLAIIHSGRDGPGPTGRSTSSWSCLGLRPSGPPTS